MTKLTGHETTTLHLSQSLSFPVLPSLSPSISHSFALFQFLTTVKLNEAKPSSPKRDRIIDSEIVTELSRPVPPPRLTFWTPDHPRRDSGLRVKVETRPKLFGLKTGNETENEPSRARLRPKCWSRFHLDTLTSLSMSVCICPMSSMQCLPAAAN